MKKTGIEYRTQAEDSYWRRYRDVMALLKMASAGLEEMHRMRDLCRDGLTFATRSEAKSVLSSLSRIHAKSVLPWTLYENAPVRGDLEDDPVFRGLEI